MLTRLFYHPKQTFEKRYYWYTDNIVLCEIDMKNRMLEKPCIFITYSFIFYILRGQVVCEKNAALKPWGGGGVLMANFWLVTVDWWVHSRLYRVHIFIKLPHLPMYKSGNQMPNFCFKKRWRLTSISAEYPCLNWVWSLGCYRFFWATCMALADRQIGSVGLSVNSWYCLQCKSKSVKYM